VTVTLVDGSSHDVDSSELAFQMAGSIAFSEGLKKAKSIFLEPIMDIEVTVPEEYMGQVIADLNTRRAKISSLGKRANAKVIRCLCRWLRFWLCHGFTFINAGKSVLYNGALLLCGGAFTYIR
jgi:translation elongation factor 2 (EF-2/EF-G)